MAKMGSTVFGAAVAMIVSGEGTAGADHYRSRCGVSGSYGYRLHRHAYPHMRSVRRHSGHSRRHHRSFRRRR